MRRSLLACCIILGIAAVSAAQSNRPNILWVVMEDTSPQFIGCYGDKSAKTPVIDQLAKEGIRFTNAFSNGTVCSPSRSAIITGVPTYESGTGNHRSNMPLPDIIKGFPSYLKEAGYYTTNNSKTDYNTSSAQRIIRESWNENSNKAGWWNRQPGQPFFAVFNFDASHQSRTMTNPYSLYEEQVLSVLPKELQIAEESIGVPPFFADTKPMRKQLARIYNGIALADYQMGKIFGRLKEDGLEDSTIVFFYADHGEGMPRAKANGIDLGHRVPFIIKIPEIYKHLSPWGKAGTVCGDLVSFIDLAPTLLNLAGVQSPSYMKGKRLLGNRHDAPPSYLFLSSDGAEGVSDLSRTISNGRFSYTRTFLGFMPELWYKKYFDFSEIMQLMRADLKRNRLSPVQQQLFQSREAEYLYDYENDPWQIHNLAREPQYREMLQEMRKQMEEEITSGKDVMFLPAYELSQIAPETTPYEFRNDRDKYPIKTIYEVASLAGIQTTEALNRLFYFLKHANPYVRYWAAMGLKAQGAGVKKHKPEIQKALSDAYPPVKIIIASVMYDQFRDATAADMLQQTVSGQNVELSLLALQMLQYQQNREAFVPVVERLLQNIDQKKVKPGAKEAAEMFLYAVEGRPLQYAAFW
ncbi:MAG: sulfatase-like hydrolase/transferase [Niabella sp.]